MTAHMTALATARAEQEVNEPTASGDGSFTPLNAEVEQRPRRSLGTPAGPSPRPAGSPTTLRPGVVGPTPRVLGLDLAANSNGVALPDGTTLTINGPKPAGKKRSLADDLDRLHRVTAAIEDILTRHKPDLVVIEDYAPGIRSAAAHRLAEISGSVRLACHRAGAPIALVNVMHLKIYATGKSSASKTQMGVAALKRADLEFRNEDECDAFWLYAMGRAHLGAPVVDVPQLHRAALAAVVWPAPPQGVSAPALFDQPEGTTSA